MQQELMVSNVKCGGCAQTIKKGLADLEGVVSVEVDVASGKVTVAGDASRAELASMLAGLGYPEK